MEQSVGRYQIRRELGRGAQSIVYLAWDPQLEREVAIKTLHFSQADAKRNNALLNEARAVSKLRHPNLVPIFDAGEQDGDPYLVFEFVEGPNLAELIAREGCIAPARSADLMRQVLDALAMAHAAGIVHCDLKPSNILIDTQGRPRVMDFGIATRLDAADPKHQPDGIFGTIGYLAPEYLDGRHVGEQNDIYAAGLLMIEMVSGTSWARGETAVAIMHQILNEPVALPSDVSIDNQLASIILTACARDPSLRTAGAAQMKSQLDDYLATAATPPESAGATESRKQDTLEFLMRRSGHAASRSSIIEAVWGFDGDVESNTVDAFIKLLRDKIDAGHSPKLIRTVRGYGYILREEE